MLLFPQTCLRQIGRMYLHGSLTDEQLQWPIIHVLANEQQSNLILLTRVDAVRRRDILNILQNSSAPQRCDRELIQGSCFDHQVWLNASIGYSAPNALVRGCGFTKISVPNIEIPLREHALFSLDR
jgi:hypothetical protein